MRERMDINILGMGGIKMTRDPASILKEALKLPQEMRAALAASLLESLEDQSDMDAEEKWKSEIARRIDDLDSATVQPVPWSEARKRILERQ